MGNDRGFVGRCNSRSDRIDDQFHDPEGSEREQPLYHDKQDGKEGEARSMAVFMDTISPEIELFGGMGIMERLFPVIFLSAMCINGLVYPVLVYPSAAAREWASR
jgi:hypothetical protein